MNSRIQEEWEALVGVFPDLNPMVQRGDRWLTAGCLHIVDAKGKEWGFYEVEITIPDNFPSSLPSVWETGGKILRTADWHVNSDGSCCVGTDARQYYLLDGHVRILNWVQQLVIPFLANHMLKILSKDYAAGERSHGLKGILEEYQELFTDLNHIVLRDYLKLVTEQQLVGRNDPCFCGSGKKYKYCFRQNQEAHRKNIPSRIISRDLLIMESNGLFHGPSIPYSSGRPNG